MSGETDKKKLRPLGRLEQFHHIRNKLHFYNSVALTAQYVIPSPVLDDLGGIQAVTFAALKTVLCRHPIMGVSVVDETPRAASWVRLNTIDLREVTRFITIPGTFVKDDDYSILSGQEFIADEHQKPFERLWDLPLWRIVIAEHQNHNAGSSASKSLRSGSSAETVVDVGFFYNHAMGDGLSGAAFHLDFLDALNTLSESAQIVSSKIPLEHMIKVPELELLPSLENAAYFPLSISFIGWEIIKAFIVGDKDPKRWTGPPVTFSPETPPKTLMLTAILPSPLANNLSAACRKNQTTVTSLLATIIAHSVTPNYEENNLPYSRLLGTVAIQLRRFTGITNRNMVDQVSSVKVPFSTIREGEKGYVNSRIISWESIRNCRAIIDGASKSPTNQAVIMLKFLSDVEGFYQAKVGKERACSFELSNIGLVDAGDSGVTKMTRMVFSQSANVTEAPYVFGVATVKGGDMAISLTWQDGVLEMTKAKCILKDLMVDLRRMAKEDDE